MRIDAPEAILREVNDFFTFTPPNAVFMRRQARFKYWDGKVRLFKLKGHTLYRGLVPRVLAFAEQRGYEVVNRVPAQTPLWQDDMQEFINDLHLPYPVRDYQYAAVRTMLDQGRNIILSPTGSGKSLMIYLMTRFLWDTPTLIVVPTLGLVTQMESDLRSYGCDEPIQTIEGGKEKRTHARLIISTWQSIYDLPPVYFEQFGCVIVDEVHQAKGKAMTSLMEKCTKAPYRFGFTGTLDKTETHRTVLEGLFGSVVRVATTDQLVQAKHLAKPKVIVCMLEYPDDVRKALRRATYEEEVDFLVGYTARNRFLAHLAASQQHNTLMLFQLVVKHGAALRARVTKLCQTPDRDVHYIDGGTAAEDREAIRQTLGQRVRDVLLASYGTMQLGVNIPSLRSLIFAHPSKSIIRVLQSIGRILRIADGKTDATIIDVVDDLRIGTHRNYAFKHAQERLDYYAAEKFPVIIKQVPMDLFLPKGEALPSAGLR